MRIAYLGPEGTFTEQALRSLADLGSATLEACSTVTVALDAVRSGDADHAIVPIENSVEGSVPVTLDELATGEPLMITREMTVPVAFSLLVRRGDAGRGGRAEALLVPVDACYRLVGMVRRNWKGFDGGTEAWAAIDAFFDELRDRAREPDRGRAPGGAARSTPPWGGSGPEAPC